MTTSAIELRPVSLRPVIANAARVLGGECLLRIANFVVAVVIARMYGAATFGIYATVLAYVTVGSMIADNGLQTSAIRQVSRWPTERCRIVSRLYAAKTLLLGIAVLPVVLIAAGIHLPRVVAFIGGLVAARTVVQSYAQLNAAILKALDAMGAIAAAQALHFALLISAAALVYRRGYAVTVLLALMVASQGCELLASTLYLWTRGIRAVRVRVGECWRVVREATPIGFTYGMASIALRLDVVFLSLIVPASAVGHFAAAQSVFVFASVTAWIFGSILLADFSRIGDQQDALRAYTQRWSRVLLITTVPAAIVGMWLAPLLLRTMFGNAFDAAGRMVVILLAALPFLFLNTVYLNRAIALGQHSIYAGAYAGALALGVAADFILGRTFAGVGIAVAALLREIGLFISLRLAAARLCRMVA